MSEMWLDWPKSFELRSGDGQLDICTLENLLDPTADA